MKEKKLIVRYNAQFLPKVNLGRIDLELIDGKKIELSHLKPRAYTALLTTLQDENKSKLYWEPNYEAVAIVNW